MVGRRPSGNLRAGPRGAAAALLAQPSLARSTHRCYDQTLTPAGRELGSDWPLSTLTVEGSRS
jgi:hypothetical protein